MARGCFSAWERSLQPDVLLQRCVCLPGFLQGLACRVPGIRLPAVAGACRLLLHHNWGPSAEPSSPDVEAMVALLDSLLHILSELEGGCKDATLALLEGSLLCMLWTRLYLHGRQAPAHPGGREV